MLDTTVDLLDRQLAALRELPDVELLLSVPTFLDALDADPRLAAHLVDLEHEADDLGRSLHEAEFDGDAPGSMLELLWDELGGLAEPQRSELLRMTPDFRRLHRDTLHPVVVTLDPAAPGDDPSRVGRLVRMVDALDSSAGARKIDGHRHALDDLRSRQARQHGQVLRTTRVHAGVALLRLRCLTTLVRDEPARAGFETGAAWSRPRTADAVAMLVVRADAAGDGRAAAIDRLLRGEVDLAEDGLGPSLVAAVRVAADRVGAELRGRVGTTRSRLALIERYKVRCEWHDRVRLAALAEEATGRRESALRDELALYLFDRGLNPLPEVPLGSARSDLFEPDARSGFLLEAKQYADRTSIVTALKAAFRQAVETAGMLPGSSYGVEEAFVVLFRRGGPRAILPVEPIVVEGVRWHVRLIDIAPPELAPSRGTEQPVEYTAETLRALLVEVHEEARAPATG